MTTEVTAAQTADEKTTATQQPEKTPSIREEIERSFAKKVEEIEAGNKNPADAQKHDDTQKTSDAEKKAVTDDTQKQAKADEKTKLPTRAAAPVKWTKEEKEEWEKLTDGLPDEVVASVEKIKHILVGRNKSMEAAFTQQMQSIAADRAYKVELDKLLEPRRQQWKASGLTDVAAIEQMLAGFDYSNRDLPGFIQWLCRTRGTSVDDLFPVQQPARPASQQQQNISDDGVQLHPAVQRMLDQRTSEIDALKQQLSSLRQEFVPAQKRFQDYEQRQHASEQASVAAELAAFERATDEHGSSKYPLFNDVKYEMGLLMQGGVARDLQSAYEAAVYARPDLRAKMLESREIEVKRDYERRMAEDAKKARGAAGSLAPRATVLAPAAPAAQHPAGSIREAIEAAAREHLSSSSRRI